MKKIMALFVALLMLLSVFPMAFAEDADTTDDEPADDECLEVDESCCIGELCNTADVLCEEGSNPVFKECDSDCNAIAECEETEDLAPVVQILAPEDGAVLTTSNLIVEYTVTDDISEELKCGIFYLDGTEVVQAGETQIAASDTVMQMNFPNVPNGEYVWNVACIDESWNLGTNPTNFTGTVDVSEDEEETHEEDETDEEEEEADDEDEASDDEDEAGITPDRPLLWGLDRAIERISLALTLGKSAKAKKGLAHARERLLEVKAMIAEKKLDAAEKAKEKHGKALGRVKEAVEEIDGEVEPEEQLEETVEIETEIEEQEQEMEEVEERAKGRSQFTEEQQTKIEAVVAKLKEDLGDAKVKVKAKKNKIKIAIQAKTGKTAEEVDALGEEIKARGRGRRAAAEPVEPVEEEQEVVSEEETEDEEEPEEVNIDGTIAIGSTD